MYRLTRSRGEEKVHLEMTDCVLCKLAIQVNEKSSRFQGLNTDIKAIYELLEERDLNYAEPCRSKKVSSSWRTTFAAIPSSWITGLQRIQAYFLSGLKPEPFSEESSPDQDPVLEEVLGSGCDSHLLSHMAEGYYVPVDFVGLPLFDTEGRIPGGWVGSSYRLYQELLDISGVLRIDLRPVRGIVPRGGGMDIGDSVVEQLNKEYLKLIKESHGVEDATAGSSIEWGKERAAWFLLFEAARLSIEFQSAIALIP